MNQRELQKKDPLKRQGAKTIEDQGLSPMSPPDAYAPPSMDKVAYEEMHIFLQKLLDEHEDFKKVIDKFEKALHEIRESGFSKESNKSVRDFFEYFDQDFGVHNKKEEKNLFPILHKRLLEKGEHSQGGEKLQTPINVLEADHLEVTQQGAVIFTLLSLSHRLPDQNSRLTVLDLALEEGKKLVETLRLHIFREENVVFPLAQKYLTIKELDHIRAESLI